MLRSSDLIWSRVIRDYLIGEREPLNDLMSWNADATRMPYRMHSEYLRKLFLNNDLAEGRYRVEGKPIALSDLHAPMFVVGTLRDHVIVVVGSGGVFDDSLRRARGSAAHGRTAAAGRVAGRRARTIRAAALTSKFSSAGLWQSGSSRGALPAPLKTAQKLPRPKTLA